MQRFLCLLLMLCLLSVPALAESLPDQGLGFITDAGIAADSVVLMGNALVVTLTNGGTATLEVFGDFDMYNLSWRFDGATDEDVGLYLDYALSLLAALEGKIPVDAGNLSTAESLRARSYTAMVKNGLESMEVLGEQGLRVLLGQMILQRDSGLDSLRARLAARLVGDAGAGME